MTCSRACGNPHARKRDPLTVLAAAIASGSSNSTLSDAEPGALGFLVVAGMGLILYFLLRSMNKHLKKVQAAPAEDTEIESASDEADQPEGPIVPGTVITDTVQTGDPKLDQKAEGAAKRK